MNRDKLRAELADSTDGEIKLRAAVEGIEIVWRTDGRMHRTLTIERIVEKLAPLQEHYR